MPDTVIFGVQMPFLLTVFIVTGLVHLALDQICSRRAFYQVVWHPGLFRVLMFAAIFLLTSLCFFS